jgi:hypothetical protein
VIKLRCEDFDELIYLFWDGRIDEGKKEKLEKHLSVCQRCKETLTFLESIERGAKEIKTKEPSQEYWDTFSSRVRERIVAQREESFSFKLKRVFENVFTFSPLKAKIAAGVVSIVFVFIVGKLYVDYRGREIIPNTKRVESKKKPAFHVPEVSDEISPLQEKAEAKRKLAPPDEFKKDVAHPVIIKEKTTSGAPPGEKMKKKEGVAPPLSTIEKAEAPQVISKEKVTGEGIELKEEQALSPAASVVGAGAEEERKMIEEIAKPEQKAQDQESVSLKAMTTTADRRLSHLAMDSSTEAALAKGYYVVDGKQVLKVEEEDTLLQEDTLRTIIESWNRYIEKNPKDSLANEGYLQVAIGYYLLSKLTQDESDLSTGIELLEKYEKQVTDPKTKEELDKKLKLLKALKKK